MGTMVKRFLIFMTVNILVMVSLSIAFRVTCYFLGVDPNSYMNFLLLYGVVFGFGGAFISLFMSKFIAKSFMGVRVISPKETQPQLREVLDTVYQMAKAAGLSTMPEVGIYEGQEINAFATGPSKNNSLVAVSTGLLSKLDKDQVRGVIGHEVAHIANGDMVTMTLIQGVINAVVIILARLLANLIANTIVKSENGARGLQFGLIILFEILFSVLGMIVVAYFSRRREFRADAGGAKYAGRPAMISALDGLKKNYGLQTAAAGHSSNENDSLATLKISGKTSRSLMYYFSTHPPLEDRIRRLETGR